LEAGSVRSKNVKNILLKNVLDACIGAIVWWMVGMGTAFGDSGSDAGNVFIGTANNGAESFFAAGWSSLESQNNGQTIALWFFQYAFAAAAATIVSGAIAERTQLKAYLLYTVVITALIYPVVAHWVWCDNGFLSGGFSRSKDLTLLGGCLDFAGSGVVHMTGGVAALCAAYFMGPRIGRFDEKGNVCPMPGTSAPLIVLGTFILWMDWYGFNPGSTLGITPAGYATIMARSAMCTTLSAAGGGLTAFFVDRSVAKIYDVSMTCNGILAGLVSITAGCATVLPWAALLIGCIGGLLYVGAHYLMLKMRLDDPVDAACIHGVCGCWGVLAVGLFAYPAYTAMGWDDGSEAASYCGLFYGCGMLFAAQIVAILIEMTWVASTCSLLFGGLRLAHCLRVSEETEMGGLDTLQVRWRRVHAFR
jgi:Amt family ammonium transporter